MKRVTKETRDLQKMQQLLHAKSGLKQETTSSSSSSSSSSVVAAVLRAPNDEKRSISTNSAVLPAADTVHDYTANNTTTTTITSTTTPTSPLINDSNSNTITNEADIVTIDSAAMDVGATDDRSNSTEMVMDAVGSGLQSDTIDKSLKSLMAEAASLSSSSSSSSSTQQLNITKQHLPSNKANSISDYNTGSSSSSAVNMSKNAVQLELEHYHNVLIKSEAEREALFRSISLETQLHREVVRWMQAMQELLWPTTDEQVYLGRPLGPPPRVMVDDVYTEEEEERGLCIAAYTKGIMKQLQLLTPLGLVHMEKAASIVGIFAVEDVKYILDIFKWLSWINLTLHLLRLPPTTPALRRILDAVQGLRCADDKVVKLLSAILQRAM
jgi:hypothetical protein